MARQELTRVSRAARHLGSELMVAVHRRCDPHLVAMVQRQFNLFEEPVLPDGFLYRPALLSDNEETEIVEQLAQLDFRPFEFRGYLGRRRVVSFGWRYDFNHRVLASTDDIPPFLQPLRARAAAFAGLAPVDLPHALVTEYAPGAPIGWHRDRPEFGDVIGVSLLSPCQFRLRRRQGSGWERALVTLAPRSAYLLRGPVRTDWEHSIPPVDALRYSITFRSLREPPSRDQHL